MEIINTEEIMDTLYMFQGRLVKIDEFDWWYLEIVSVDVDTQITSMEFQDESQTRDVQLTLAALEHSEMNLQVKVTWRTLRTIAHSLMVHARVFEACIKFALMYMADHIFPVLPIKDLINEDRYMPFKLATDAKPSISHLCVLFCPFAVH